MSAELIERLTTIVHDRQSAPAEYDESTTATLAQVLEALTAQDKRIAELEGIVAECERQFQEQVALRIDDMDKAESALSLAESRGRQIGREEAAKASAAAQGLHVTTELIHGMRQGDPLEIHARKMTKALTGLTANGSEFFIRIGENYYADVDRCVTYIRDRHERTHDMLVQEVTARKAAEAERDELREALRQLADKVDVVAQKSIGVFAIAYMHGAKYDGPTFEAELTNARDVLGRLADKGVR